MWSFIEFFKPRYLPYCLLDGFFQGGRLIVGATSVTYLLSQNLSFAQIAQLKSIQAIVFLFLDVPAGIFADSHGRKKSLLVSVITAIFSFFLYFNGAGAFSIFVVAEIFAAVSICFWSGAYEAYTLEKVKLEGHPKLIDQFFHFNQFFF